MIIKLNGDQIDLLVKEAQRKHPIEICGALFGDINDKKEARVKRMVLLKNLLNSETRFQINPTEFLEALLNAEREGLQHIGFFHSHPTDIKPSAIDLKYMKLWPEIVWLIISPSNRKIAAYQIINGRLCEVYIKMTEQQ